MKKCYFFAIALMVSLWSYAGVRSDKEICHLAGEYLSNLYASQPIANGPKRVANNDMPEILLRHDLFSLAGYRDGGFVLVCADEAAPAVWGYSEGVVGDSVPSNMAWWLDEMSKMVREAEQPIRALSVPDGLPSSVSSLVSARWGQHAPFNLWHVYDTYEYLTGCVATSMAQIMYSHGYPEKGRGQHSYVWDGKTFSVDFSQDTYDWASMTDTYVQSYNITSSTYAVATLMRDCGYAVDMQYGTSSEGGSGAAAINIAAALRNYFAYNKYTRVFSRDMFTAEQWQEILFTELSKGNPVSYGGSDASQGGHQFIVDGYRNDGFVHVNWGWTGSCDGYYAIASMNPTGYKFSLYQSMVIGIQPETEQLYHKTIAVATPGTLRSQLTDYDMTHLQSLKVSGDLNGADIATIRALAGFAVNQGDYTGGQLTALDMEDANIVQDLQTPYLTNEDGGYYVRDNTLPIAFLSDLMQWEHAGLSELILPTSLTKIGQLAMPLCFGLTSITIPSGVTSIGSQAFFYTDMHFKTIISHAVTPPVWNGDDVFGGDNDVVFKEATLYVPAGSLQAYQQHTYWSQFQNIKELNSNGGLNINVPTDISTWQQNPTSLHIVGSGEDSDDTPYSLDITINTSSLVGTFTELNVDWDNSVIEKDNQPLNIVAANIKIEALASSSYEIVASFTCANNDVITFRARKDDDVSFAAFYFNTNDQIVGGRYTDDSWADATNNKFLIIQAYNQSERATKNYCRLTFWVDDSHLQSYNDVVGPVPGIYHVTPNGVTVRNNNKWQISGTDKDQTLNYWVVNVDNQLLWQYGAFCCDMSARGIFSNYFAMWDDLVIVQEGKNGNIYVRVVDSEENTWCTIGEPKSASVYNVSIATNNQTYGTIDVTSVPDVPEGTTITISENTLTIGTTTITATPATATAQYTYAFTGWTLPDNVTTVTEALTITANFTRTTNKYDIVFLDDDNTELQSQNLEYGATITAPEVENKEDADYIYTFLAWSPAFVPGTTVTGVATYKATYTATPKVTTTFTLEDQHNAGEAYYTTLADFAGSTKDVTYQRTFGGGTADAPCWSTFSLPFDYLLFGNDRTFQGKVVYLDHASYDAGSGMLTLNFMYETYMIEANKPYALYNTGSAIVNPVFEGVEIAEQTDGSYTVGCTTGGSVTFTNTQTRQKLNASDPNTIYVAGQALYFPGAATYMRAFSGYFVLNDVYPSANIAPRVRVVINEEDATAIMSEDAPAKVETKKYMENGILVIERAGIRYTAQGACIR